MRTVRKTITLTDTQDGWINAQIAAGRYTDDSECIRDLIRREQEHSAEIDAIRAALVEGEAGGEPRPFDTGAFKQRMLARPTGTIAGFVGLLAGRTKKVATIGEINEASAQGWAGKE